MKTRFDGLDVCAMVSYLQGAFTNRRVVNVYDGGDSETYVFKFDKAIEEAHSKPQNDSSRGFVLIESGKRFHPLAHFQSEASNIPSPFAAKLRKHLRGLRLSRVFQVGRDRVVVFSFTAFHLILELYDRGNLILCDASYAIMALLRSHVYNVRKESAEGSIASDAVVVQVGHVYPVAIATTISEEIEPAGFLRQDTCLDWVKEQILSYTQRKTKKNQVPTLKTLLLNSTSGCSHFGPALLEHCILTAQLDPHKPLDENSVEDIQWQSLRQALTEEGDRVLCELKNSAGKGYIRYTEFAQLEGVAEPLTRELPDKIFQEFLPYLFIQFSNSLVQSYESFGDAVQDFFQQVASHKAIQRQHQLERASQDRILKVRKDQESRVEALQQEQEILQVQALAVQRNASSVDAALTVVNSALNSGMNWEQLEQLIQVEQDAGNPIASLIHELRLKEDSMVLKLLKLEDDEAVLVTVSLKESAHANASILFARYRAAKEKSAKTIDSLSMALKAAEENAKRQLESAQRRLKTTNAEASATVMRRKPAWFEKFHWFITTDNYLVLGGKDAHQNEMLVKRYLRPGDAYIHADVFGSTSTILRAKRRRERDGRTIPAPLSGNALSEAGNFTICRSSAWTSRMVTSAWWVEPHQVSKTAPSGEYLTVGSFMVRGKKNFLPPAALEMGIAVLFRLGDEESISRHMNERRDFALMALAEQSDAEDGAALLRQMEICHDDAGGEKPPDSTLQFSPSCDPDADAKPSRGTEAREVVPKSIPETSNEQPRSATKKKGLSARDRRLMKKYGTIEEAERAMPNLHERKSEESVVKSSVSDTSDQKNSEGPKRGKRAKMKRAKMKYGDQDEEDRILAMLALQGGEKAKRQAARSNKPSVPQGLVASETAALLNRDVVTSVSKLPESVRALLIECLTIQSSDESESDVQVLLAKLDADCVEQLASFEIEAQLASLRRLRSLVTEKKIENVSACLGGVLRMIRRYGHEGLTEYNGLVEGEVSTDKQPLAARSRKAVAEEGVGDIDVDDDAVDDTTELNKLTGKPHPDDTLLFALPVCAPYQTLSQYSYRVKLTPGSMKRGKAVKQCVEMLSKLDSKSSSLHERCVKLIKGISESDWVQAICPDVKITSPGASKAAKGKKGKTKSTK